MLLTLREVAALLDVPEKTVERWVSKEGMPAYRVQDEHRFHRTEVLEWAVAKRIPISSRLFGEVGEAADLEQALTAGGVYFSVEAKDAPGAIREAVRRLPLPKGFDLAGILPILVARPDRSFSLVGEGVAIPSARSPIILPVSAPAVTLCFLATPLGLGKGKEAKMRALFVIAAPTVRTHLLLVSRLAGALHDPVFRSMVAGAAPAPRILEEARRMERSLRRVPTPASS